MISKSGIHSSLVRALPVTLTPIRLIARGKDLVVGTNNKELSRLSF